MNPPTKIPVPDEILPLLGKKSDRSLGEQFGVGYATVRRWRMDRGIPTFYPESKEVRLRNALRATERMEDPVADIQAARDALRGLLTALEGPLPPGLDASRDEIRADAEEALRRLA